MGDRITICSGCTGGAALAAPLRAALAEAGLATDVAAVECMVVCAVPASLSIRAEGKAAYLFEGVTAADLPNLVALARLFAAAPDGIIEDARPCGDLRFRLRGRIPA